MFRTTRWSLVVAAQGKESRKSDAALTQLCEQYWFPLYAFVRRRGFSETEAKDLTQSFFVRLLEKQILMAADPNRGRFRTFLLACMKNFLADEWGRGQAQKRGGGLQKFSIDHERAEALLGELAQSGGPGLSPEEQFDQEWAQTLLASSFGKLRNDYVQSGKAELFDHLSPLLVEGKTDLTYAELAEKTGMSEGAIKVAVHRLRKRYGAILREAVAETLSEEEDVETELRYLLKIASN